MYGMYGMYGGLTSNHIIHETIFYLLLELKFAFILKIQCNRKCCLNLLILCALVSRTPDPCRDLIAMLAIIRESTSEAEFEVGTTFDQILGEAGK